MRIETEKEIYCINKNICLQGFSRYDPNDLKLLDSLNYSGAFWKFYRNFILVFEQFFPILLRKIFRVKKTPFITAYTHVGEALYTDKINELSLIKDIDIEDVCDELLTSHYIIEEKKWPSKPNNYFFPIVQVIEPTMHLHGLARANILLLKISNVTAKKSYINISLKTLEKTLSNHFSEWKNKDVFYVSYMYNSIDCTLNVNSEVAEWISLIPEKFIKKSYIKKFNGIINLLLTEQNEDGSWDYYSKEFSLKRGLKSIPDSHHNATIIYNLIHVLDSPYLNENVKDLLYNIINKGVKYLIETFFFEIEKQGYVYPNKCRIAGPVQYSESVIALCDFTYIEHSKLNIDVLNDAKILIPKLILKIKEFIQYDGSVAGERVFKWVNVDSIRWGNGPCLQALIKYEEWVKNEINE